MIKVFRLNDYEYWAGENLETVKAEYLRQTGVPENEAFDDPEEITPDEMATRPLMDDGDSTIKTFADGLAGMLRDGTKVPCYFAGTEY